MPPTPYWGQLPGPRVVEDRRSSVEGDGGVGGGGGGLALPSHNSKANRASTQTTDTQTTATTFHPSATTPTDANFAAGGLAPRPPSYQRPPVQASQFDDMDGLPIQQVPAGTTRALQEGFEKQQRYLHREPPYSTDGARPTRKLLYSEPDMDYGEPHSALGYDPTAGYGSVDDAPRRPSENSSGRRKKSATNKSPLQKLELTLNRMTKEEKRARIEAAERRARERASRPPGGATGQPWDATYSPPHRSRPSASYAVREPEHVSKPADAPLLRDDSVSPEVPGYPPAPVSRHKHSQSQSYRPISPLVQESAEPLRIPSMSEYNSAEYNPNPPTRNLSFRERAARDETTFPHEDDRAPRQQQERNANFPLTQSDSNKLGKNPPGDAWNHAPEDAGYRAQPKPSRRDSTTAAAAVKRGESLSARTRDKELPPEPREAREVSNGGGREAPRIQRRATEPAHRAQPNRNAQYYPEGSEATQRRQVPTERKERKPAIQLDAPTRPDKLEVHGEGYGSKGSLSRARSTGHHQGGLYRPPRWLDDWKRAQVGLLGGFLLDVGREGGPLLLTSFLVPSRFKPPLYLDCGPLVRYSGLRRERDMSRSRIGPAADKEIWRGSIMIVTKDSDSSYEVNPTLRLFVQDMETLPAPPHDIRGELPPEYVDPIAGHPKLGRRGETLFLRPVEHLAEGRDLSQDETENGLFESTKSTFDGASADGSTDFPGSFACRIKRADVDGEKLHRYKDVLGFRLHAEQGSTFWRFNIEVELRDKQQRIAYRINRGPANAFWVPAKGEDMHVMFHSCNGFSMGVQPDDLSGPDPMWRDVLNTHQISPFHVMVGGGDQIYNDDVADECDLFIDWLEIRDAEVKRSAPFTPDLQAQVESFYFRRYCTWFSRGMFGLANSQIPMVNIWSDRETFNGFGSYPHQDMRSPVLSGVGAVSFKYYMLFQHQSIIPETEESEPSWILGSEPGPYVNELAHNVFVSLGPKVALLAADCRTERTEDDVIFDKTWERVMDRLYAELKRGHVEHLLVVLPVPIAYPRVAWLENVLKSRAINPIKALGKRGLLGKTLNNLDGGFEMMDDLRDHWTAKNHMDERKIVIEDLQDLAIDKSLRITILSGDVNMAAVGQFCSDPKLGLAKHKDPRYMPNVISSGIANMPPPGILADALNKRHKTYEFDRKTEESMILMFRHGVDGRPRKNQRLLPHRNWCSIRQWAPGNTPPPTPPLSERSASPLPSGNASGSGLLRRLSLGSSSRPNMSRDSVRASSRPPISNSGHGGGIFRSLSRSLSRRRKSTSENERPATLTRTVSSGGPDLEKRGRGFSFGRRNSQSQADNYVDAAANWRRRDDQEPANGDDYHLERRHTRAGSQHVTLRGGAAYDEFSVGDEARFTARPPQRSYTVGSKPTSYDPYGSVAQGPTPAPRPFHRTPTGLSAKQMRNADDYEVNLEGGLDICLNVEVNPRDPTGITVPYRLLVPKLDFDYSPEADRISEPKAEQPQPQQEQPQQEQERPQQEQPQQEKRPTGIKRFLSLRSKARAKEEEQRQQGYDDDELAVDDELYQGQRY
ncbi:hypothetical protein GMORB2_3796 [Geosmithia morbida]|uniref:PhoD-like phosphatase domain-containing protein n=1 Tax=Geosmithia morbida TaxID=1094350 RepID=A0A9P4Z038_9HYPO|nr:uncharacterized protein GMORB2_3796 [Geosmithia morbida]KAF4124957.1 hypothetical protein GMORB2_3796 [Geosmithia morbida]